MNSGTTPSLTATIAGQPPRDRALDSQALDYLPDGIFTCRFLAGNLIVAYANRACRQLLGCAEGEPVEGRPLRALIGARVSAEVLEALHRAVAARHRLILMLPTHPKAGERRVRLLLRPALENGSADWVGSLIVAESTASLELRSARFVPSGTAEAAKKNVTVDATAPEDSDDAPGKAAQLAQELSRARSELEELGERIAVAVVRWSIGDEGERLRYISRGAELLTGHPSAEILNEPELLFSGTDRDSRAAFRRAVERARRDLTPIVVDFPVRHRDSDERRWLRLSATPRVIASNEVLLDGLITDATVLREQERAVLAVRNQLHTVARAVPGVVYQSRFGLDGRRRSYLFVSEGSREILGAEPRECVKEGVLFERSVALEDMQLVKESLELAVTTLSSWELEFRVIDRGGRIKWLRAAATPGEASGDSVVFTGIITDITAEKLAERALVDTRTQLQQVTRSIPGGVFQCVVRDRLELSYISDGALALFGCDPGELTGPLERLLAFGRSGGAGEALRARLEASSRELRPWREEFEVLTAGGDARWLRIAAHGVEGTDGVTYYHGVITDETDEKLAEIRFADGERRLELALESGGLGLVDWAISTGRAIYNPELAKILGYEYQELGTSISALHDLEHPGDAPRKQKELQAHFDGETREFNCRYRLRAKNGDWRWVSARGRVVERSRDGGALRYVGTIRDVDDRMVAERRLEQQVVFARVITKISSDLMSLEPDDVERALSGALRTIARFFGAEEVYLCEDNGGACMVSRAAGSGTPGGKGDNGRPGCVAGGWTWLQARAATREFVQTSDVRDLPDEALNEREDFLRRGVASFLMVPLFIGDENAGWLGFEFSDPGRSWDDNELSLFQLLGEIISQTVCRRRRERALEAAEARVREITRAVPGAVAQVYRSPEGKFEFRYLSRTVSGCNVESAIEDPGVLLERMDERDRRGLVESLAEAAANLTPWQFDYRIRNEQGETIWVTASAYPTRLPDGGTLFNGIATDVTDRKRAEEALQRSEERFRDLYESTPVMMHSTDARGRIVNVNREWLHALGYAREDVIGRRTEDFLTRASRLALDNELRDLSASSREGVQGIACQMIKKGGELIDAVLSLRAERAGPRLLGVSASIIDVTDRNKALRALEESEERFRAVVRDQIDLICRFDLAGSLQFANEPCRRFLRSTATSLEEHNWYEWIEPVHRERIRKRLLALPSTEALVREELRMVGSARRWFQWTVRGFFSQRGELTGYQAVGRDIQDLKELETEIREISHREQKRIGHDLHDGLGQELTGISLMLKTLEQAVNEQAPDLRPKVGAVRDMVGQSIATTRALAQGLSPVHLERDGFAGALSQLAANTESVYGTPVRFSTVRGAPIADLSVTTDLYRIAQEALNNAARHACARQITVNLAVDRESVRLEISDDGRGIEAGSSETSGMGMKIMRYRANMIDASLDILPREAGGTLVRCTLQQGARVEH